jgi:hypothetical protein
LLIGKFAPPSETGTADRADQPGRTEACLLARTRTGSKEGFPFGAGGLPPLPAEKAARREGRSSQCDGHHPAKASNSAAPRERSSLVSAEISKTHYAARIPYATQCPEVPTRRDSAHRVLGRLGKGVIRVRFCEQCLFSDSPPYLLLESSSTSQTGGVCRVDWPGCPGACLLARTRTGSRRVSRLAREAFLR